MAIFSKVPLSGSVDGMPISVFASATPGTIIHTAQSGTNGIDEVWIYAVNTQASSVKLTLEYGGSNTSEHIEITVAGESGLTVVVPGLVIQNSKVIRAFAETANVINLTGYVNRIL
jgi:hypothetical protein